MIVVFKCILNHFIYNIPRVVSDILENNSINNGKIEKYSTEIFFESTNDQFFLNLL